MQKKCYPLLFLSPPDRCRVARILRSQRQHSGVGIADFYAHRRVPQKLLVRLSLERVEMIAKRMYDDLVEDFGTFPITLRWATSQSVNCEMADGFDTVFCGLLDDAQRETVTCVMEKYHTFSVKVVFQIVCDYAARLLDTLGKMYVDPQKERDAYKKDVGVIALENDVLRRVISPHQRTVIKRVGKACQTDDVRFIISIMLYNIQLAISLSDDHH